MSQNTQNIAETSPAKNTSDPLGELGRIVDRAVEFAKQWEAPYRSHIFELAVAQLIRGLQPTSLPEVAGVRNPATGTTATPVDEDLSSSATGKVSRMLGVDPVTIERIVHIDADGKLQIVGRLDGKARRELQIRYSLAYCFVKEIGLGQRDVDIEELRALCIEHGCYDAPNFTANFKKAMKDGLLLEVGGKVGRNRRFRASKRGLDEAAVILRQIAEG